MFAIGVSLQIDKRFNNGMDIRSKIYKLDTSQMSDDGTSIIGSHRLKGLFVTNPTRMKLYVLMVLCLGVSIAGPKISINMNTIFVSKEM